MTYQCIFILCTHSSLDMNTPSFDFHDKGVLALLICASVATFLNRRNASKQIKEEFKLQDESFKLFEQHSIHIYHSYVIICPEYRLGHIIIWQRDSDLSHVSKSVTLVIFGHVASIFTFSILSWRNLAKGILKLMGRKKCKNNLAVLWNLVILTYCTVASLQNFPA